MDLARTRRILIIPLDENKNQLCWLICRNERQYHKTLYRFNLIRRVVFIRRMFTQGHFLFSRLRRGVYKGSILFAVIFFAKYNKIENIYQKLLTLEIDTPQ